MQIEKSNAFIVGNTYECHSACDHNCIFTFKVIKRTAKFVTVEDAHGRVKRAGITVWDDVETARPMGTFSMAPIIRASDTVVIGAKS
jgi:hypothetical protein